MDANAKAPTIDAVAEAEAKIQALEAAAEKLAAENDALRAKTQTAEPLPEVKVGKATFRFTVRQFRFEGRDITAAAAAKDKALLAQLLEIGFGGLEQVI